MRILWKIILIVLGKKRRRYVTAVKCGKEPYVITIEKYIPVGEICHYMCSDK